MTQLHMETDVVRTLASQLKQIAEVLRTQTQSLNNSAQSVDWIGPSRDEFVMEVEGLARQLVSEAEAGTTLAGRVENEVAEWEQMDAQYVGEIRNIKGNTLGILPNGATVGGGVVLPSPATMDQPGFIDEYIGRLDDMLKPISWISNSKQASKIFDETLKNIGRFANSVTGQRGNIKFMSELGDVLTGATKVVGAASNLLTLRDYYSYINGHLTNQQVATKAVESLLPIPILNARIADWLTKNMPDPNGVWRGLVPTVQSN